MKRKLSFVFIFLFSLFTNLSFSKISISGSSVIELKNAIAEFESILPENQFVEEFEPKIGFADVYLKKVGDKYDEFVDVIKANQRLLKLTSASGAFVYCKFINQKFLPNLIENTATTSMKYLSMFMDSLLTGAVKGAFQNYGITGKIVGGVIVYSVINNMLGIGLRSVTERFIASGKKSGEYNADMNYQKKLAKEKQKEEEKKIKEAKKKLEKSK